MIIPLLFLTFVFAGELEVEGDLKVTGNIDAQNNPIKNVGVPQDLTDAINGNALQDALRDDSNHEYKMYYVATWMGYHWFNTIYQNPSKYTSLDFSDTGDNWEVKLNTLALDGWKVVSVTPYGTAGQVFNDGVSDSNQRNGFILFFLLKRSIEEN